MEESMRLTFISNKILLLYNNNILLHIIVIKTLHEIIINIML